MTPADKLLALCEDDGKYQSQVAMYDTLRRTRAALRVLVDVLAKDADSGSPWSALLLERAADAAEGGGK